VGTLCLPIGAEGGPLPNSSSIDSFSKNAYKTWRADYRIRNRLSMTPPCGLERRVEPKGKYGGNEKWPGVIRSVS
jgi:hypothetical protein